MATMTVAAANTSSSELGAHVSTRVNSPEKALTRASWSAGSGSCQESRGQVEEGVGCVFMPKSP